MLRSANTKNILTLKTPLQFGRRRNYAFRHFSIKQDKGAASPIAIFISGDGLALYFEHRLAKELSARGVESIVIRSIHYFWRTRTPDHIAKKIGSIIESLTDVGSQRPFLIVGYSFGGAVAPFSVDAMPKAMRDKLVGLVLLAPALKADFEFSFLSWINISTKRARDVTRQLELLCRSGVDVTTVHGKRDYPRAAAPLTGCCRNIVLPGGHGFGHDFKCLADIIAASALADVRSKEIAPVQCESKDESKPEANNV